MTRYAPATLGAATLAILGLIVFGIPRLFYPALHMDESLYVGAALRILSGDLFLTDYWFDKFFMTPVTLSLGILVGGESPLGFRLAALVCSGYGLFVALSMVGDGTRTSARSVWHWPLMLVTAGLWLSPFMLFHHISSFTDPFLLLFLLLSARQLSHAATDHPSAHPRWAYHFFAIACLFKMSALMWAPMLVGFWVLRDGVRGIGRGFMEFLVTARWWIIAGVGYSLANPEKLAPVLWFKNLTRSGGPGFFERLPVWIQLAGESLPHPMIVIGLVALWLGVILSLVRFSPDGRWTHKRKIIVCLWVIPSIAHAVGLTISGAATFDRYLYILWPQVVLTIAAAAPLVRWPKVSLKPLLVGTSILGVALLATAGISYQQIEERLPSPAFGRALFQIRDETPQGAVVHNDRLLWYLHPFNRQGNIGNACSRPECWQGERLGRSPFGAQYHLSTTESLVTQSIPTCSGDTCGIERIVMPLSELLSEQSLRQALRLGGWVQDVSFTVENDDDRPSEHQRAPSHLDVGIRITPKALPKWLFGEHPSLRMKGRLVLLNNEKAQRAFGPGRWSVALRLEETRWTPLDANLVDLAPILFKSYTVPLGPVDVTSDHSLHEMITDLHLSRADEERTVTISRLGKG